MRRTSMFGMRTGLVVVLFGMIAAGCATLDYCGTSGNIIGKWKFKNAENGPQTLTFKRGGEYELDTDGNGVRNIWGKYTVTQNWVILKDIGGESSYDCGQEGAYVYKVSPNDEYLTFSSMADQCVPRIQAMTAEWVRVHKKLPEPIKIKI